MAPNEEKRIENCEETTDILNERCIQEISHDEKEKLLATFVYKSRKEIIQKYGYSQFAIWFQEESFFNYWTRNGLPWMVRISSDRRKALREQDAANKAFLQV